MDHVWVPVRLPLGDKSYLQDITVYLRKTDTGVILIDSGLNVPESYATLTNLLDQEGYRPEQIDALLLTHYHLDHSGLALRLQKKFFTPVYIHRNDGKVLEFFRKHVGSYTDCVEEFFSTFGIPDQTLTRIKRELEPFQELLVGPSEMQTLEEGQEFETVSGNIAAVFTPGHTPGHVSFMHTKTRILFGGDFLLEREFPHVGIFPHTQQYNPLKDYINSLEKIRKLRVSQILPSHGKVIRDPERRIADVYGFIQNKIADIYHLLKKGPLTVMQICNQGFGYEHDALSCFFLLTLSLAYIRYLQEEHMVVAKRDKVGIRFTA